MAEPQVPFFLYPTPENDLCSAYYSVLPIIVFCLLFCRVVMAVPSNTASSLFVHPLPLPCPPFPPFPFTHSLTHPLSHSLSLSHALSLTLPITKSYAHACETTYSLLHARTLRYYLLFTTLTLPITKSYAHACEINHKHLNPKPDTRHPKP